MRNFDWQGEEILRKKQLVPPFPHLPVEEPGALPGRLRPERTYRG